MKSDPSFLDAVKRVNERVLQRSSKDELRIGPQKPNVRRENDPN